MYYPETNFEHSGRFRNAVIAALIAHVAIISSVSFKATHKEYKTPQIEVTLATFSADQRPEDAHRIAASNQVGSGNLAEQTQLTSRDNLPQAAPNEQQLPRKQQDEHNARYQDAITTDSISRRMVNTDISEKDKRKVDLDGISPEVDRLNAELASLQADLDKQNRTDSEQPRVRRLSAASAKQSVDAAYLLDWRKRLEAVGNRYYPEASVRYGIYGDLRLLVVILADGSLEDVRILSSSGYAVLDEAAIKIVRMGAPYAPFPPELKATTDKLEIVRTWQFQQNQLSSSNGG